ncbi:hypothetical protein NP493_404g01007 [Ridgeia piscesae]|uniref:Uncharacterized protein n=1 Tax=Ridgeia piscesae TaxID=27915 RepID=A0AAD9L0U2_RIDPI|nr:hypothetical protein NP493_404g01007 [Ridgeia piscesae]
MYLQPPSVKTTNTHKHIFVLFLLLFLQLRYVRKVVTRLAFVKLVEVATEGVDPEGEGEGVALHLRVHLSLQHLLKHHHEPLVAELHVSRLYGCGHLGKQERMELREGLFEDTVKHCVPFIAVSAVLLDLDTRWHH